MYNVLGSGNQCMSSDLFQNGCALYNKFAYIHDLMCVPSSSGKHFTAQWWYTPVNSQLKSRQTNISTHRGVSDDKLSELSHYVGTFVESL